MTANEFKVKWAEDLRTAPPDRHTGKSAEERQVHRMRMLRHMLNVGGFKLSHTDQEGFQVYVKGDGE